MKPIERIYNKGTDKQWSSEVYHKAKQAVEKMLSATDKTVEFGSLCEAVKQQHRSLCLDDIKEPTNPRSPYWKHLVASAIQALKKEGKVHKADGGWVWKGVKPSPTPDEPDKLAEELRRLVQELVELAKRGKEETPRPTHDELVEKVKEMGEMLARKAEGPWGPVYKHDCVWRDNPYSNPRLVWEICDKGNLDKDIASLIWAVKNWNARCILVVFDEPDFHAAQKKLAQEPQIYPLKADDVVKLHALLQAGHIQAIRTVFAI